MAAVSAALREVTRLLEKIGGACDAPFPTVYSTGRLLAVVDDPERRRVAATYAREFAGVPRDLLRQPEEVGGAEPSYWMYTPALGSDAPMSRDELMAALEADAIESRPAFYPMHVMPVYRADSSRYPVATEFGAQGISLPTHARLSDSDIRRVAGSVKRHLGAQE